MNDIHALSGAYSIDALDDAERARFEEHLAECASCRAEVDSLREAAALLPDLTSTEPPASLRDSVLSGIREVRPLPPLVTHIEEKRRRRFPAAALLAAASVVAVLGVGTAVIQPWDDNPPAGPTLSAAERVLAADDATRVTESLDGGGEATVVVSASEGRAVIVTEDLPAAPPGKVYELWLQKGEGSLRPAGLLPPGAAHVFLLEGDARGATAVGITVEPAGGSRVPSPTAVAMFNLQQAT